jgi:hypothetical protein
MEAESSAQSDATSLDFEPRSKPELENVGCDF